MPIATVTNVTTIQRRKRRDAASRFEQTCRRLHCIRDLLSEVTQMRKLFQSRFQFKVMAVWPKNLS